MKLNTRPATSKLVASFDNELMNLLMEDLKVIRQTKSRFLRLIKTEQLSVA